MKKLLYIYPTLICACFAIVSGNVHANETLREINTDITILQGQKVELQTSWENFRNEQGGITDYIKKDLSPQEKVSLSSLLNNYLEEIRTSSNNLELRKIFFENIAPYIDKDKYTSYEKYKETGFRFEQEKRELTEKLQEKKDQREERTDILKTYIADNALERREKIQSRVEPLLRDKLDIFIMNPGFQQLSIERKSLIFGQILGKIQEQRSLLETSGLQTSVVLDRIATYGVIESIMIEYIEAWR